MLRKLFAICFITTVLAASPGIASEACFPESEEAVKAAGLNPVHPSIPYAGEAFVGTLNVSVDGQPNEFYCTDLSTELCYLVCYEQGPDLTATEVVHILNNFYPALPGEPAALATDDERAAAVQLAIWHFTDGIDISTGGSPIEVFDAARAIIAAALTAPVPVTPTTLTVTPPTGDAVSGTYSVTIELLDQNGSPIAGETVAVEVTGSNTLSDTVVTGVDGTAEFSYSADSPGIDTITASIDYTIPIGLSWYFEGCQDVITGVEAPGRAEGVATVTWDAAVPGDRSSWGTVKSLF